jgi:regulator of sigma E protease
MMILTLIIAFFSLIALMIIHEFGHFIIAKKFGIRVEEFGIGYPPRIFGKKIGETIYSINLLPLGAFVRIYGEEGGVDDYRSFTSLKIWQRILIVIGGVAAFWIAAIILFSVVFAIGTVVPVGDQDVAGVANAEVKIIMVSQGSPADESGLKQGDTILSVKNGDIVVVNKIKDFQDFIRQHLGQKISIEIKRGVDILDIPLTPRVSLPPGEGPVGIGLERMATLIKQYPWYQAPIQGVIYTWQTTVNAIGGLFTVFTNLFSGKGAPEGASFAGPLGITVFLARAAEYGVGFFLYFIGTISVFIAIFNLFPIPALDGGKLLFLIIEKIKGRPISPKIEQAITVVFFVILITLSIFITVKFDIPRFLEFLR